MYLDENKEEISKCRHHHDFKATVLTALERNLFAFINLFSPCYVNVITLPQFVLRLLNIQWWSFGKERELAPVHLFDYHVLLEYVEPFVVSRYSKAYDNMLSFLTSFFSEPRNNLLLARFILERVNGLPSNIVNKNKLTYFIAEIQHYVAIYKYVFVSGVYFFIDVFIYIVMVLQRKDRRLMMW